MLCHFVKGWLVDWAAEKMIDAEIPSFAIERRSILEREIGLKLVRRRAVSSMELARLRWNEEPAVRMGLLCEFVH